MVILKETKYKKWREQSTLCIFLSGSFSLKESKIALPKVCNHVYQSFSFVLCWHFQCSRGQQSWARQTCWLWSQSLLVWRLSRGRVRNWSARHRMQTGTNDSKSEQLIVQSAVQTRSSSLSLRLHMSERSCQTPLPIRPNTHHQDCVTFHFSPTAVKPIRWTCSFTP